MALYRVVLSETHYILRGVIPSALRQSVDTFASYLVWVTTSSIEILNDHGEVTGRNGRQKIEQVVTEFIEFTKDTYQVSESVINELNFRDVYSDILTQLSDLVDFQLPSVDDFKTPF